MSLNGISQPAKRLTILLAIALWVLTVVLAIWDFLILRGLVLRTIGRFGAAPELLELVNILLIILLTVWAVAIIIGGAEYHRVRIGQPNSWQMFSRTLAVEIAILILPLFI